MTNEKQEEDCCSIEDRSQESTIVEVRLHPPDTEINVTNDKRHRFNVTNNEMNPVEILTVCSFVGMLSIAQQVEYGGSLRAKGTANAWVGFCPEYVEGVICPLIFQPLSPW